jgi:hypothetical protein
MLRLATIATSCKLLSIELFALEIASRVLLWFSAKIYARDAGRRIGQHSSQAQNDA